MRRGRLSRGRLSRGRLSRGRQRPERQNPERWSPARPGPGLRSPRRWAAGLLALLCVPAVGLAGMARAAATETQPAQATATQPETVARVEAKSADLLAVGTVRGERMTIHLSRIADNAPVRDAVVAVLLRGTTHPAVAEADGSYSLETPDLALPGAAAVQFQVTHGSQRQYLQGALQVAGSAPEPQEQGTSRQLGWWVLNFAVCIGFLLLWSRRKSAGS